MIKEIKIIDPMTSEEQPNGGEVPIIDPYDGCQLACPYCWQLFDENWNKDILVHINIADLLPEKLSTWNKSETIYIGSRCDPYMPLEEKYGLTRKCLSVLNELCIKTMIVTKADNDLIFRDIDILKNFNADLTVLMGLSNINQVGEGILSNNISTANKLNDDGINVWAFITPVLPYIMDVDEIIESLNSNIPVYLDKLGIEPGTLRAKKMMKFIENNYPEFIEDYELIINENDERYFDELIKEYSNDSRVKILF